MLAGVPGELMTRVRRKPRFEEKGAVSRRSAFAATTTDNTTRGYPRHSAASLVWKKLCLDGVIVRHYFDVAPH